MGLSLDDKAFRLSYDRRRRAKPFHPLADRWLERGFPRGDRKRVLLIRFPDRIAAPQFYPFYHYADRFADAGYVFRSVSYPALGAERLIAQSDAIFLQTAYFPQAGEIEGHLERIRRANPHAPISFFDWFAPTDVRFADRVGDVVSFYTKKSLLRDRGYYRRKSETHTFLDEHYCQAFDLEPDAPDWGFRPDIADRLVLAPGFATWPEFIDVFERGALPPAGGRSIDVHARFDTAPRQLREAKRVDAGARTHWYVSMREHARAATARIAAHHTVAWQGMVPKAQFMAELNQSRLCFSPFGFGELCWRDIEAIVAGAVLVKPSMEHLDCFCDIYVPGETYMPLRWDLADFEETVARLLASPEECRAMAERAFARVRDYLNGPKIGALLDLLTAPASQPAAGVGRA